MRSMRTHTCQGLAHGHPRQGASILSKGPYNFKVAHARILWMKQSYNRLASPTHIPSSLPPSPTQARTGPPLSRYACPLTRSSAAAARAWSAPTPCPWCCRRWQALRASPFGLLGRDFRPLLVKPRAASLWCEKGWEEG